MIITSPTIFNIVIFLGLVIAYVFTDVVSHPEWIVILGLFILLMASVDYKNHKKTKNFKLINKKKEK